MKLFCLLVALLFGPAIGVAQTSGSPAVTQSAPQPADAAPTELHPAKAELPHLPPTPLPLTLLPHDLSPWGMFLTADLIVKIVMVGLAFASLVTWTVWLAKGVELLAAKHAASRDLVVLTKADSLDAAAAAFGQGQAAIPRLVAAAADEADRSAGLPPDGIKERAVALLTRIEARVGRAMARGTGVLATIGATAPFVGLFGTVWGIMNSFIGISKSNTTNLAVVAPGIAEALLATAIGLVAAIPAVVIYNVFARGIMGYRALLADASAEVLRHLSRDLDRQSTAAPRVRALRQPAE